MKANTLFSSSITTPSTTIHQFNLRMAKLFQQQHTLLARRKLNVFNPLLQKDIDQQLLILDTIITYELTH